MFLKHTPPQKKSEHRMELHRQKIRVIARVRPEEREDESTCIDHDEFTLKLAMPGWQIPRKRGGLN
jgi:hypothetical protein